MDAKSTASRIVDQAVRIATPNAIGDQLTLNRIAYAAGRAAVYARSTRFGPTHEMTMAFRQITESLTEGIYGFIQAEVENSIAG